jgi:hypothetical protein
MSGSHVRRKAFGRLSLSIERQGITLVYVESREEQATYNGSNTELGI